MVDINAASIEDIVKHNETVRARKNLLREEFHRKMEELRAEFHRKMEELPKTIAPCAGCKFDGAFRCDACADNDYEGYNVRNYPPWKIS